MPYTYSGLQRNGNYGDYYRGDYYRGDPFLKDLIRKGARAVGTVAKTVGKFVPGPGGAVLRGAGGVLAPSRPSPLQGTSLAPYPPDFQLPVEKVPGVRGAVQRILPGGATGYEVDVSQLAAGMSDGCPKGYHRNKSDYYTQQGFHPAGSKCVKNRRMNVVNPRALRRGIRRAKGAVKLLRKSAGAMGYTVHAKRAAKLRKR